MKPDTSFVLKSGHFHLLTTLPGRQPGRQIKMPADCFVPRLVTENAVGLTETNHPEGS